MAEYEYVLDDTGSKILAPKSDIRIMNEAMTAAYDAQDAHRPPSESHYKGTLASGRGSDPHDRQSRWLSRKVSKITQTNAYPPSPDNGLARPKNARIARWMDRHTSRMLDPMHARASIVSSAATILGSAPSVSPASVVSSNRESMLSEMGEIRRDAVPPPLDMNMVARVRKMQESQLEEEEYASGSTTPSPSSQALHVATPPPTYSPVGVTGAVGTESSWTSWGADQPKKG